MKVKTRKQRIAPVDRDALERAMEIAMRDPRRAEQLQAKLVDEDWVDVAEFAASCCQSAALRLKPWDTPPCSTGNDPTDPSAVLLDKMIRAGISPWEPDPFAALAKTEGGRCCRSI